MTDSANDLLPNRREQILVHLAAGYTSKELAPVLGIAYQTVKNTLDAMKKAVPGWRFETIPYIIFDALDRGLIDATEVKELARKRLNGGKSKSRYK